MKSLQIRIGSAVKRVLVFLLRPVKRVLGRLLQVVENDELRSLRHETARLSSASVESVTYLGGELRRMDERLTRLEQDLAAVRALLEGGAGRPPEPERAASSSSTSA